MTIGERVRIKRESLNMTQDELAKKMGYKSRSSVNKMEVSRELTLKTVRKLAIALDCSVSYLMGWEETSYSDEVADYLASAVNDTDLMEILKCFRNMSIEHKKMIVDMAIALSDKEKKGKD